MTPKDRILTARQAATKLQNDFNSKKIIIAREEIGTLIEDHIIALDTILAMLDAALLKKNDK